MTRPRSPAGRAHAVGGVDPFVLKKVLVAVAAAAITLGTPVLSAAGAPGGTPALSLELLGQATSQRADIATIGGPDLASTGVVVGSGVALPPTSEAASYLVADIESGDVLAAKAAHEPHLPASTQKILTALTLLPVLDKEQVVVGTPEAAAVEGSKAGIDPGLRYSVDLVFKAMLLQSGNDAAHTLALTAGGVDETVAAMNDLARELQALDTVVVNPSGLDAPGQVTSAYDLALITRAALARDDFRTYLTTSTAEMPDRDGGTYQIQNENRFLAEYDGAIGVKNGYTTLARHTFVGAAQRDGRTLVVVVMRTEVRPEPIVAALMDWGFANAATAPAVGKLAAPGDPLPVAPIENADEPGGGSAESETGGGSDAAAGGDGEAAGAVGETASAVGGTSNWLRGIGGVALVLAAAVVALRARVLWRQRTRTARAPTGPR